MGHLYCPTSRTKMDDQSPWHLSLRPWIRALNLESSVAGAVGLTFCSPVSGEGISWQLWWPSTPSLASGGSKSCPACPAWACAEGPWREVVLGRRGGGEGLPGGQGKKLPLTEKGPLARPARPRRPWPEGGGSPPHQLVGPCQRWGKADQGRSLPRARELLGHQPAMGRRIQPTWTCGSADQSGWEAPI